MSDKSLDEKTREFGEKDFGEREEFGAENLESYSVENDRETMSSNKRIKEMPIDWLSALPDSLIIHILSFLETKEAAITSVLSKRWRFLWTESPRLGFEEISWETRKIRVFVTRVHRILVACSGNYLEHFGIDFRFHKCFASDVDAWLEFTIRSKVKEVSLRLHSNGDLYTLPQMMYSNSSLTSLWMQGCIMAPQRTIEWQSLTSLEIQEVEVPQLVVEKILSGCPVLYCLVLRECWVFNRLEVNSQSLYKLGVNDCDDADNKPLLEISAPYILSLDISLYPVGRKLQFLDISSLVRAGMDFTGPYWYSSDADVMSNTKELFENVQHVQELEVGWQCFDVVSMLAVNGWRRLKCLTVKVSSNDGSSISGIIGLLESSPNLETLVIEGFHPIGALDTWDPPVRGDLVCDLLHLKTVTITEFADPKFGGEPMVTLTRILLKRATVLEKMVIEFDVENISDFDKIGQKLLTFPRFSQKALVQLSYQL